jgi:SAM-dependent methyltransferase
MAGADQALNEARDFLRKHLREQTRLFSGNDGEARMERITENWFNDQVNYDGRWRIIEERVKENARILDMAAGCGTFLLYGLHRGRDVWGVEPEQWKRQYFAMKINASRYPDSNRRRLLASVGEALPFADSSFDFVTSYQTLEHVQDVGKCLEEMLRVLKPGGVMQIAAPDYRGFLEPHYGILFVHKLNPKLAASLLRFFNRPLTALTSINWITETDVMTHLQNYSGRLGIKRSREFTVGPHPRIQSIRRSLQRMHRFWKEPIAIDLWVTKIT